MQSARLADKRALHHALIDAKLRGELDQNDFADTNQRYKTEIAEIEAAQKTLISEADTLRTLSADNERQLTDLLGTRKKAGLSIRQELQSSLFPDGLVYSESQRFLCTANESLQQALFAAILEEATVHGTELLEVGLNGRGEWI